MTPPVSRREARKSALTLLYQWDVTERAPGELYEGEIDEYAQSVTSAVQPDSSAASVILRSSSAASRTTAEVTDCAGSPRRPRSPAGPPTGSVPSSGTSCGSRSTSSTWARSRPAP